MYEDAEPCLCDILATTVMWLRSLGVDWKLRSKYYSSTCKSYNVVVVNAPWTRLSVACTIYLLRATCAYVSSWQTRVHANAMYAATWARANRIQMYLIIFVILLAAYQYITHRCQCTRRCSCWGRSGWGWWKSSSSWSASPNTLPGWGGIHKWCQSSGRRGGGLVN